jgi:6-phospho-3-hexuloisomerase
VTVWSHEVISTSDQPLPDAEPRRPRTGTGGSFPPVPLESCADRFPTARDIVLDELRVVLSHVPAPDVTALARAVSEARNVVVIGAGRSKLAVEAFAMRLAHMGVPTHVYSDVTAPPVGTDDLVLACSGSGETKGVVDLAAAARGAGARLAAVVAKPESSLGKCADIRVVLREYNRDGRADASQQFIGTLFEQSALLFFDSVVLALEQAGAVREEDMRRRHTNME